MFCSTIIIEDFIEEENIDSLLSLINDINFSCAPNNPNLFSAQISNIESTKIISEKINCKLTSTIQNLYSKKVYHYTSGSIVRYTKGQFIGAHADWAPEDDYVINENKIKVDLSSILYLNENFIGGELCFLDDHNLKYFSIKPKKNMAIFFDALKVHYTEPIVDGIKYSYTSFYSLGE